MRDAIAFDIETRSTADLKKTAGRAYADHPSTELLSAGWFWKGAMFVWSPRGVYGIDPARCLPPIADNLPKIHSLKLHEGNTLPPWMSELLDIPWCAHNTYGFDEPVWCALDLPQPVEWLDTLPWCSVLGLPRGLDTLGEKWFGVGKDTGSKTLLKLSQPIKKGRLKGRFLPLSKMNLPAVLRYMVRDIQLLAGIMDKLADDAQVVAREAAVIKADYVSNKRGILLDKDLANAVLSMEAKLRHHTATELTEQIGKMENLSAEDVRTKLRSVPQFTALLENYGCPVPNAQRATLMEAMGTAGPEASAIILARIGETRITSAKLERGLAQSCADNRLRGMMFYHAAHTGRWGGRGMQLQNLPRPNKKATKILDLLIAALLREGVTPAEFLDLLPEGLSHSDALATVIRACLLAGEGKALLIADYSNIEARVLLWLAGDEEGLRIFWEGGDPYKGFASQLFGVLYEFIDSIQRAAGKVGVLGCGFGLGGLRMGAYAHALGVDLESAGLTPQQLVETWRDSNPLIAGTRTGREWQGVAVREGGAWKDLQNAFIEVTKGGVPREILKCRIERWRNHTCILLPSGKPLIYRNARMELRDKFGKLREGPVFDRNLGKSVVTVDTYGGKLMENITQATARECLAEALVRRPVPLHVHDEFIDEVNESNAEAELLDMLKDMTRLPRWAKGLPLAADGAITNRYGKVSGTRAALCGKEIVEDENDTSFAKGLGSGRKVKEDGSLGAVLRTYRRFSDTQVGNLERAGGAS